MNRLEIIKNFMTYFGEPAYRLITEGDAQQRVASNTKMPLAHFLKQNESEKYKAGLFFTPNGDYGKDISDGEKYEIKKGKGKAIHALFVDLDVTKTGDDLDKAWEYINETIVTYKIPPSFVIKSGGGYHLYWVFNTDLSEYLKEADFAKIQKFLAKIFPYGDESNVNHLAKLMRVPLSYHWKHGKKLVELFKYTTDRDIVQITTPEEVTPNFIFKWEHVKALLDNIEELKKVEQANKNYANRHASFVDDVNKIKVPDFFDKLDYKLYHGKKYKFKLGNQTASNTYAIDILYEDGTIQHTDGYRYNAAENYVHNFSLDYHPITERPRGGPIPFLYYYFNKNWDAVDKFLREHYNIGIKPDVDDSEQKFSYGQNDLIFSKEGVILYVYTNEGEVKTYKIIQGNWRVKDYTEHPQFKLGGVLTDGTFDKDEENLVRFYRLQNIDTGKIVSIQYVEDKKTFNKRYGVHGLRLDGSDTNLLFNILDANVHNIPKVTSIWRTGYYKDYGVVAIPNTIVYSDGEVDANQFNIIIDPDNDFSKQKSSTLLNQKPISLEEGFNMFKKLYTEHFSVVGFLQFISLFGFDIWDKLNSIKIYSGLGVFGKSGTGKSTFVQILKSLMGLEFDFKLIDASSGFTTPQGIKKKATDYFPLTVEEFTKAPPHIEEILRGILNHTEGERGIGNHNIKWEAKTGLIILGEDTPSGDSVINRTVIISLRHEDRLSTESDLHRIKTFNFYRDVYKKFYELEIDDKYVISMLQRIQEHAKELKINTDDYSRLAETFVKVFIVGEKFLKLDRDYIINAVKNTQKNILVFKDANDTIAIKDFVYGALQKGYGSISEVQYRNGSLWEVSVPKEYGARKRHILADLKSKGFNISGGTDMIFLSYFIPDGKITSEQAAFKMIFEEAKIRNNRQYSYADMTEQEYFII